jgi:hypothetical protein
MNAGVLYISQSDDYLYEEAVESAHSVNNKMPELPLAVVTNTTDTPAIFDETIVSSEFEDSFVDKVKNISKSPFDKTLFLDTDTYMCASVPDLFKILSTYDIAVTHSPHRADQPHGLPTGYPEYNTGVLAFRDSTSTSALFDKWESKYESLRAEEGVNGDQTAFRHVVHQSDVRFCTITPAYNCRTIYPGYVDGEVKIVHGRHDDIQAVVEQINKSQSPRVHYLDGKLMLATNWNSNKIIRLFRSLRSDGLKQTINKVLNR